jgi:hypothetical protein
MSFGQNHPVFIAAGEIIKRYGTTEYTKCEQKNNRKKKN